MESAKIEQKQDQGQENIFLNFFCFRNIFETAVRYWKIAVLCAILGVAVSFVYTKWLATPKYMSKSTIFSWWDEKLSEEAKDGVKSIEKLRQLQMAQLLVNDYRALLESDSLRKELGDRVRMEFRKDHPEIKGPLTYTVSIETRRETRVLTIVATAKYPALSQYVARQTAAIFQEKVKTVLKMDNVQVIDEAKPGILINKSMRRNLPVGFIVGLMVGIALALLLGFIDQTIKNPEQAKRYLDVPVMGVIPKSAMPEKRSMLVREMLDNSKSQELVEAYRLLRTNLQYLVPSHAGRKGGEVFMFTSSIPHEGKSSSIALVSLLTARAGKKVLLIDADMHKPVQSRIFNLRSGTGFVSVLTGDKTVEEVVHHVEDCLDVMPCGPIPPNPSELLMSERMPQLLDELRQKYDYVFIDITPALFLSDPLIVKPLVDGVLFMVACSQTKIGMIQRTLRQLQQVSKTPIGLVVNQFDRGEVGNRYGYYGYYRYHSYYRYYRDYAHDDNSQGESVEAKKSAKKEDGPKQA